MEAICQYLANLEVYVLATSFLWMSTAHRAPCVPWSHARGFWCSWSEVWLGGGIFKSPLRHSHVQLEPMATAIDILKCVQNIFKVIHWALFVAAEAPPLNRWWWRCAVEKSAAGKTDRVGGPSLCVLLCIVLQSTSWSNKTRYRTVCSKHPFVLLPLGKVGGGFTEIFVPVYMCINTSGRAYTRKTTIVPEMEVR